MPVIMMSWFVVFLLTVLQIQYLISPLHLGLFLVSLTILVGALYGMMMSNVYGLILVLVMAGGVVVSFLFTVAVIESHVFYTNLLGSKSKNFMLMVYMGLVLFVMIEEVEDYYLLILYVQMVLWGLGAIILICLVGTIKSCSFGLGPLRSKKSLS